jgi:hypothetical protein
MDDVMKTYDTFGHSATEGALKVILKNGAAVSITAQTARVAGG